MTQGGGTRHLPFVIRYVYIILSSNVRTKESFSVKALYQIMAAGGFLLLAILIAVGTGAWVYNTTRFEHDPDQTILDAASQSEIQLQKPPAKKKNILVRLLYLIDNICDGITMLSIWLATRMKFLL